MSKEEEKLQWNVRDETSIRYISNSWRLGIQLKIIKKNIYVYYMY